MGIRSSYLDASGATAQDMGRPHRVLLSDKITQKLGVSGGRRRPAAFGISEEERAAWKAGAALLMHLLDLREVWWMYRLESLPIPCSPSEIEM